MNLSKKRLNNFVKELFFYVTLYEMKHTYLDIPIWNRQILLIVEWKKDETLALIQKYNMHRSLRSQVQATPQDFYCLACVWMDDRRGNCIIQFPTTKVRTDTIIHETNHIVRNMFRVLGAQQEKEAHAYTQEYLYHWIRKSLKTM